MRLTQAQHQHGQRNLCLSDAGPAGFFQGIMRSSPAYDEASKELIAGEYARSTHAFHGCSADVLKTGLLGTIDLLWAMSLTA